MPSSNGSDTGSAKALANKSASGKKKSKTGKTRRVKKKDATPLLPSEIVCTPQALAASKNSVELGLLLSMAIVGLYLYGFWESIQALPDVPTGFLHGQNLNLNKLLPDNIVKSNTQSNKNSNIAGGSPQHQPGSGASAGAAAGQQPQAQQQVGAPPNLNEIPEAVWPVKYKEEVENKELEAMIHPGDLKTTMWIPKMWSYPIHHNQQFTREQAMKIGSCIEPDPVTGSYVRGDKCPPEKRTIFIAIASYRDFQCRYTVESAFNRAAHPERIRFGTCHLLSTVSRNFVFKAFDRPCAIISNLDFVCSFFILTNPLVSSSFPCQTHTSTLITNRNRRPDHRRGRCCMQYTDLVL